MNRNQQINNLKKQKEILEMFKKEQKQNKHELVSSFVKVKKLGKHPLAK